MKLTLRGQTCHFLFQRGVYWEEQKTLILADIHIGKAAVFRKAGIPIPEGDMEEDLRNIRTLVETTQAQKCIIVGDLIHAKSGLTPEVKKLFSDWLHSLNCEIHLVLGNHDHSLVKDLPKEWPLTLHKESLLVEPFYFSHYPTTHPTHLVWSGHIHPKVEIKNYHDRIVLRCFQLYENQVILPAFGSFTGGTFVKKDNTCRLLAIAGNSLIEL